MECDVCGFEMSQKPEGSIEEVEGPPKLINFVPATVVGMSIQIEEKLSNFIPRHVAKKYNICYSCLLEAVGVKANKTSKVE